MIRNKATRAGLFLFFLLLFSSLAFSQLTLESVELSFETTPQSQIHYLGSQRFELFTIEDLDLIKQPGYPALPVKVVKFYVPRGQRVAGVEIESVETVEIPGTHRILPAQEEIPIATGWEPKITPPDEEIYLSEKPFPESPVVLSRQGHMAGRKIADVRVYPIQYIPRSGKLLYNRQISFRLLLEPSQDDPPIPRETPQVRQLRKTIIEKLVTNPQDLESDFETISNTIQTSEAVEYLILCHYKHEDEYEMLKHWKTRKGIPTEIRTFQDIVESYSGTDDAEKLRNCIIDYYLNRSTVWVLISGAEPRSIIRGCYCRVGTTTDHAIPCDLYFADLDGTWNDDGDSDWGEIGDGVDLYPDVYVGRLPANTGVQCTTAIYKVLTYEGYQTLPSGYQLDMLFMAEYLDQDTDAAIAKNIIDNESIPSRFDPITKLYESSGNLSHDSAINALNSGMGIVNHNGHGNASLISIGPSVLTKQDAEALTNAPRFTVFYTVACDPGAFDNPVGCFGRSFVISREGGGFFVGNSRYGWYWAGNPGYGTGDRFDREFFKAMFVRDYDHLGVIHADAKVQRIPQSRDYGADRWTQFSMNLFGDPETPVWKDTPLELFATYDSSIEVGSQTFVVSVSDGSSPLEDAHVCLWKVGEIYEVKNTDSGGIASFTIAPQDTGVMYVTVTKNGYLPHIGSTTVTQSNSGVGIADPGMLCLRVSPNPQRGTLKVSYFIPAGSTSGVAVRLYDARGRLVSKVPAEAKPGWNSITIEGHQIEPGIYFIEISTGKESRKSKVVLLN